MKKKRKTAKRQKQRRSQKPVMQISHQSISAGRTSSPSTNDIVVSKLNLSYHRHSPCLTSMAWGLVPDELVETS